MPAEHPDQLFDVVSDASEEEHDDFVVDDDDGEDLLPGVHIQSQSGLRLKPVSARHRHAADSRPTSAVSQRTNTRIRDLLSAGSQRTRGTRGEAEETIAEEDHGADPPNAHLAHAERNTSSRLGRIPGRDLLRPSTARPERTLGLWFGAGNDVYKRKTRPGTAEAPSGKDSWSRPESATSQTESVASRATTQQARPVTAQSRLSVTSAGPDSAIPALRPNGAASPSPRSNIHTNMPAHVATSGKKKPNGAFRPSTAVVVRGETFVPIPTRPSTARSRGGILRMDLVSSAASAMEAKERTKAELQELELKVTEEKKQREKAWADRKLHPRARRELADAVPCSNVAQVRPSTALYYKNREVVPIEPMNQPSGLRWECIGSTEPKGGRKISNSHLAFALQNKAVFTQQEWKSFAITDLRVDDYIWSSSGAYFKPLPDQFQRRPRATASAVISRERYELLKARSGDPLAAGSDSEDTSEIQAVRHWSSAPGAVVRRLQRTQSGNYCWKWPDMALLQQSAFHEVSEHWHGSSQYQYVENKQSDQETIASDLGIDLTKEDGRHAQFLDTLDQAIEETEKDLEELRRPKIELETKLGLLHRTVQSLPDPKRLELELEELERERKMKEHLLRSETVGVTRYQLDKLMRVIYDCKEKQSRLDENMRCREDLIKVKDKVTALQNKQSLLFQRMDGLSSVRQRIVNEQIKARGSRHVISARSGGSCWSVRAVPAAHATQRLTQRLSALQTADKQISDLPSVDQESLNQNSYSEDESKILTKEQEKQTEIASKPLDFTTYKGPFVKEGWIFKQELNTVTNMLDWRRRYLTLGPSTLAVQRFLPRRDSTQEQAMGETLAAYGAENKAEEYKLEFLHSIAPIVCRNCTVRIVLIF